MTRRRVPVTSALLLASACLLGSCVTMNAVKPTPDLKPVAIGGGKGSLETTIDPDLPREAELFWQGGGALMVRPTINDTDVGWFVLDTGASGMVITGEAARKAELVALGTTRLQDGSTTTVFLSETFKLGPMVLRGTRYAGVNFPHSSMVFGENVAGIGGFDLLAGTVFEIDAAGLAIRIFDPDTYTLPASAQWQPLELHGNLPHTRCTFEGDHAGLFVLDTGYANSVCFFQDTVDQYDLLDGRKTRGRWVLNFGASTRIRQGPLQWFQLGPTRIVDIKDAQFATEPMELYPGPDDTAGMVGMNLMGRVRMVFDYPHQRIAFIPVEPAPAS